MSAEEMFSSLLISHAFVISNLNEIILYVIHDKFVLC
jgi:hypothetical protein